MGNNLEHATRTQGKPHAGRGQLLSVSTLLLSNLDCKFFEKRAIMSSVHSTGHMWAPQAASAAAQPQGWGAETWWEGQGLQGLGSHHSWWHRGDVTPLVTLGRRMRHSWWHWGGGCDAPGDTGEVVSTGSLPMSLLPSTCCRSSSLPVRAAQPSLHWCSRGTWEPDKENHLSNLLISMTLKSFNFYDTANRVKGIRGTGPKINSTLQTVNKAPYECKTVTCTVTNTTIF